MAEGDPDRSERELRADVATLSALDVLINERGFDLSRARKGAQLIPSGLSPELHRFLPLIFSRGTQYFSTFGYLPAHVARRSDAFQLDGPDSIRISQVVSLEDDNIGLVPQLTGPAVGKIIETLRSAGAHGFLTRQWMHSNLLPTLHYLSHAAWERGWTPESAYQHLFGELCGPEALGRIERALLGIEKCTEDLHRNMLGISFPVPTWITNLWSGCGDRADALAPQVLTDIASGYEHAADELERAIGASRPAGRSYLRSLERHTRHAVHYLNALVELVAAFHARKDAARAREARLFEPSNASSEAAADHLERCAELMRRACTTFAEGVRDRCDLGALASLNSYSLDIVDALARLARAEASMFSLEED